MARKTPNHNVTRPLEEVYDDKVVVRITISPSHEVAYEVYTIEAAQKLASTIELTLLAEGYTPLPNQGYVDAPN